MKNARIAYKKLEKIASKIGYGEIDYKTLSRMLNKEFKSLKVRFVFIRTGMYDNYMVCGGYYNPPPLDEESKYVVTIEYGPKYSIKVRKEAYTEIFLILVHEFRHGQQYRARNFRKRRPVDMSFKHESEDVQNDVRYWMDYDEVDANAMEVAESLRMGMEIVNKQKIYRQNRDMFGCVKAWKKFMKKVYKYSGGLRPCYL